MKQAEKAAFLIGLGAIGLMAISQSNKIADVISSSSSDFNAYDALFQSTAQKYGLDWKMLKAISWTESDVGRAPSVAAGILNPSDADGSVSEDGLSWGIMQETLDTANWLRPGTTVSDLNNPSISIDLAGKYFQYLLGRYNGDVQKAVISYNQGPGNTDKGLPDTDYWDKYQRHYSGLG